MWLPWTGDVRIADPLCGTIAVSSYPMAVAMDADGDFAAQMVAYTTVLCLPTIFLWTLLLNTMGWM